MSELRREGVLGGEDLIANGLAEPVRVRFTHVTDTDIEQLVAAYAPGPRPVAEVEAA